MPHPSIGSINFPRRAFTLIELLVVIAIIAILAVVVVLTLNPAQLLAQSRDSERVSDMATLSSALNLYMSDQSGASSFSLGTTTNTYISIADSSSTCGDLGMPSLGSSTWACSLSSQYRNASSSGWLPVNLSQISSGSPLGSVPVDPVNQTSSGLFYAYNTNGSQFEATAILESQKYKQQYGTNAQTNIFPEVISAGIPTVSALYNPSGLVGYWPLNEGAGMAAMDQSGSGNNGTWGGTMTSGSYYGVGKVGTYAGNFNGTNDYVGMGANNLPTGSSPRSVFAWVDFTGPNGLFSMVSEWGTMSTSQLSGLYMGQNTGINYLGFDGWGSAPASFVSSLVVPGNSWHFVGFTYSGTAVTLYLDNQSATGTISTLNTVLPGSDPADIGRRDNSSNSQYFPGLIDDVRIYNRALSPAEVTALYDAEK